MNGIKSYEHWIDWDKVLSFCFVQCNISTENLFLILNRTLKLNQKLHAEERHKIILYFEQSSIFFAVVYKTTFKNLEQSINDGIKDKQHALLKL